MVDVVCSLIKFYPVKANELSCTQCSTLTVNFHHLRALIMKAQQRNGGLLSRRAARDETLMQVFCKFLATMTISVLASGGAIAQNSNYTGSCRQIRRKAGSRRRSVQEWDRTAMIILALAAAWASAPTRLTRKVPVIFHRRAGSYRAGSANQFWMNIVNYC